VFELQTEILEHHEALLTLEITEETIQKAMRKAARRMARQFNIPGFRKGKAPYNVVVRTAGEETVRQEAAETLLEQFYPQALKQAEIEPYDQGEVEDLSLDPLVFKIRVPLQPLIDLGDYRNLRREPEPLEVTDEELASALEDLRRRNMVLDVVTRPARLGDQVTLSLLKGTVAGEVVIHDHNVEVVLDTEDFFIIQGFVEAVVGMSAGEERLFSLTLPDDFGEENFQGEDIEFTVNVEEVYQLTLPGLDDALASTVGSFGTLEDLKDDLRRRILDYKTGKATDNYLMALVADLVAGAEVRYPPIMEEEEIDTLLEEAKASVERRHDMEWEDYLRLQGKTEAQVRKELRPEAARRMREGLILGEFASEVGVTVTDAEVKEEIRNLLEEAGVQNLKSLDSFDPQSALANDTRQRVVIQKTLDKLELLGRGQLEEAEDIVQSEVEAPGEDEKQAAAE
jgi:trigger factor